MTVAGLTSGSRSRVVRPWVLGRLKMRCTPGLRRSASTSRTERPVCAKSVARFAAVTVLPSPGTELVIRSVRIGSSIAANSMFARRMRYASDAEDLG